MNKKQTISTKTLVGVALLTAIVVVLQLLGSFIRFGVFSVSLVLIPIVIGAALYGAGAGAWLGAAFGVTVLLSGDAGAFLVISPIGTIITVMVKGTLAGLAAGLAYRAVVKVDHRLDVLADEGDAKKVTKAADSWFDRNGKLIATVVAAVVCPVVNTGVFLLGCLCFFMSAVTEWAEAAGFGGNVGAYMIVGFVGLNFLFELLFNVILSPVVVRILTAFKKISSD